MTEKAKKFMRKAIQEAEQSISFKGGPFGAVIVKDDQIIAEAHNRVVQTRDPTAHAEIEAIRTACAKLDSHQLTGCEIFSSSEPCPMCLGAIYWARLDRLWYACSQSDAKGAGFDDQFIYEEFGSAADDRHLETTQLLRDEGVRVFHKWLDKPSRAPY